MHLEPTSAEITMLASASGAEIVDYFVTRTMECEEVWGLANDEGWVMTSNGDQDILPVWPYAIMARECANGEWCDYQPDAISLEHFVFAFLPHLKEHKGALKLIPGENKPGLIISAEALFEIFERKLDAQDYFIEA